jgi:hypothetical protein
MNAEEAAASLHVESEFRAYRLSVVIIRVNDGLVLQKQPFQKTL